MFRSTRTVLVGAMVCAIASRPAHADEVDDLVTKGEELAKRNEYSQAIAAFKQADAKRPRAAHACMIGLAYMRREAWPQAELFLALCEKRAVPGDQPPDWVDAAHQSLATKLREAQIPAITIEVTPRDVGARLSVSSFTADEVFEPQTIHLAPGKHVIEVTAPGYLRASREVTIEAGVPQTVTFALEKDPAQAPTIKVAPSPQPAVPHRHASPVPWIVMGTGAVLLGTGLFYDLGVAQESRDRLASTKELDAYNVLLPEYRTQRNVTFGLLGAGVVVAGVGVALKLTVFKSREAPQVSASVSGESASIVVGWQR
ncbi:MAG TPA: carboxypeptidase-like regulatory domain-containing protein [Kofleriaceae bacterium]|nr:carboxypeptidase-like regulatory domain-containing protein [Kofleriaceae bacterium]